MEHKPRSLAAALQAASDLEAFVEWIRSDADRLLNAAELLGGHLWRDRVSILCTAIIDGTELYDLIVELRQIHRLLTLEFVADLDSEEARRFLSVHPDDPRADDARLCAEALERALTALTRARIKAHAA
jgi:hypothetical protein